MPVHDACVDTSLSLTAPSTSIAPGTAPSLPRIRTMTHAGCHPSSAIQSAPSIQSLLLPYFHREEIDRSTSKHVPNVAGELFCLLPEEAAIRREWVISLHG